MSHPLAKRVILAADVGGTNLSLALMVQEPGGFRMARRATSPTRAEVSLLEPMRRFLAEAPEIRPDLVCVSGAGPVRLRRIPLTNAPWDIDGAALEAGLGLPVQLFNDFTAVSHGVLLLDPADPVQLLPLPHLDGSLAAPDPAGTVLIVGAGTGLGVGYVTRRHGIAEAFPSEGGHIGLPVLDEETLDLWRFLREGLAGPPGAELAVSGPGIGNILAFLVSSGRAGSSPITAAILALPAEARPAAISAHAGDDPACARAMALFVDLYARVCAELCAVFLPTGGLFLAGGIAAKNQRHFLEGRRFMRAFEENYRVHLDAITHATPVAIVKDYAISLYGAAQAGCLAEARTGR
jgi:glucokinase